MSSNINKQSQQLHFLSNINFQYFDQFRLINYQNKFIHLIDHTTDVNKKIKALINGCIKRNNKLLYKGQKYYTQDLQFILNNYPALSPQIIKSFNVTLNKLNNIVYVQCHNCANFAGIWKFCPKCENIHYCHEGCQMKIKFTHERQQCRIRPFPKSYKALQIQIHVGSDLGKNVNFFFQHELSMTLLLKGQQLLDQLINYFKTSAEGKAMLDDYEIKCQNKMLKFEKQSTNPSPQIKSQTTFLKNDNIDQISRLYTDNRILRSLELYLLQNGGILCKTIRQIHDNHLKEIFIFRYP